MDENKKDKRKNIIILILVLIIALGGFFLFNRKEDDKPLDVDTEQSSYVKPETPVDRRLGCIQYSCQYKRDYTGI